MKAVCRPGHLLSMLLAFVCVVFGATSSSAVITCDLECDSGTPSKTVGYSFGKYTVNLYNIGSTNVCELSVESDDAGTVFHLSAPVVRGLVTGININSESGDPISGGTTPVLKLSELLPAPGSGADNVRTIFASLGLKFEVLKEVQNHYGMSAKRLNKGGPIYLVTWDGALDRFMDEELQTDIFFIPEVILRLDRHRLLNASACFRARYDEDIAHTRKHFLPTRKVEQFRNAPRAKRDTNTENGILEIAADYLYSGREEQAWQALHEMWPANDQERIKNALLHVYQTGILAQTDGLDHCEAEPSAGVTSH